MVRASTLGFLLGAMVVALNEEHFAMAAVALVVIVLVS